MMTGVCTPDGVYLSMHRNLAKRLVSRVLGIKDFYRRKRCKLFSPDYNICFAPIFNRNSRIAFAFDYFMFGNFSNTPDIWNCGADFFAFNFFIKTAAQKQAKFARAQGSFSSIFNSKFNNFSNNIFNKLKTGEFDC